MYVLVSIVSGSSGMSTSKRDCTSSSFLASDSVDTNEIDRPLVPNLSNGKRETQRESECLRDTDRTTNC